MTEYNQCSWSTGSPHRRLALLRVSMPCHACVCFYFVSIFPFSLLGSSARWCRFSQENARGRREAAVPRSVGEVRGPPQEVPSAVGGQVDQWEEGIGEEKKGQGEGESKQREHSAPIADGVLFVVCAYV